MATVRTGSLARRDLARVLGVMNMHSALPFNRAFGIGCHCLSRTGLRPLRLSLREMCHHLISDRGCCHWRWWIIRPVPETPCRADFPFIQPAWSAASSTSFPPHWLSASLVRLCDFAELFLASVALKRLSMVSAAGDNRGLPLLSIVGWFAPLPWLGSAGDSVVPDVCHFALGAV
jgi:hypothetical protein